MFPDKIDSREFELLTVPRIHGAVEPFVSQLLGPAGFESHRRLTWVRSTDAPIRQVFQLTQLKGGALCPSWGLSLDFVPHVSGSRVRWHRTPKSAMLDLRVQMQNPNMLLTYMYGERRLLERAPRVLESATLLANEFWEHAKSIHALPAAFETVKRSYDSRDGLGFYTFVQHGIAYAFTLALVGRNDDAQVEIRKFLERPYAAAVAPQIRHLLTQTKRV